MLGSLLNDDQLGFLKDKSTMTSFNFSKIPDVFVFGYQVDVVFTNFKKAFNKLSHYIQIVKANC